MSSKYKMQSVYKQFIVPLLLFCFCVPPLQEIQAQPVALWRAHAHNDYEHDQPLYEALERGIGSVEVDIFLVEDQLLVAHDLEDVKTDRTLESLYLAPLKRHIAKNNGRVYGEEGALILLIDIKSEAESTYEALRKQLAAYGEMLTRYEGDKTYKGAVTAIISGNRPREMMMDESVRWAAYDGRLSDLGQTPPLPVSFMPLVSNSWMQISRWFGHGAFPDSTKEKLTQAVQQAHDEGRIIRFWATSDNKEVWETLYNAGVDLLNADDLEAVQAFLLEKKGEMR